MRTLLLLSLALLANAPAQASSIYKWVDSQGNTHFSSQPPSNAQATTVNPRIASASTKEPTPALETPIDPQKEIDEEVKQKVAEHEKERQAYCQTQRTNLAQLRNNPRVQVEDQGQMKRLTEEERQEKIQAIEKSLADECA